MFVHVWAEDRPLDVHREKQHEIYPDGIQGTIAGFLQQDASLVVTASTSHDAEYGLSETMLSSCDVLVYWSHKHWREVPEPCVEYLYQRVLAGMGLVVLHSAHASRIFSRLLGTRTQIIRWRENDERQRVWNVFPAHPIAEGLPEYFDIPMDETYGEYFEIPQPDEQVFLTAGGGGEVLRSGDCFYRGRGRIFYFSSGHETYPVYWQPEVQKIITNAVHWASNSNKKMSWPVWARESTRLQ
jgi:trehalose utilization protein